MDLYDLKTKEEWQELLTWLAREVHMAAILVDEMGVPLQSAGEQSPLCQVIRQNEALRKLVCPEPEGELFMRAGKKKQPVASACEAGLLRLVIPIVHNDEFLGAVSACSVAGGEKSVDFKTLGKQFGVDQDTLKTLVGAAPFSNAEDLHVLAESVLSRMTTHPRATAAGSTE